MHFCTSIPPSLLLDDIAQYYLGPVMERKEDGYQRYPSFSVTVGHYGHENKSRMKKTDKICLIA